MKIPQWLMDILYQLIFGVPVVRRHRASFLFDRTGTRAMDYLDPNKPAGWQKNIRRRCKANGDTLMYVYLSNERDLVAKPYSPYVGDGFGGKFDKRKLRKWKKQIKEIHRDGIGVVFFLWSDDAPTFARRSPLAEKLRYTREMVKTFDWAAHEWVIEIEDDEPNSIHDPAQIAEIAKCIHKYSDKKVGRHLTPGKWEGAVTVPGIDVLYYQAWPPTSPRSQQAMAQVTENVRARLPAHIDFIMSEYHGSSDSVEAKELGRTALTHGADGVGNGS